MKYSNGGLKTKGFLLDTNILLEILLGQEKKELAKKVIRKLMKNPYSLHISDFTLHSVGIKFWKIPKTTERSKLIGEKKKKWGEFLDNTFPGTDIRFNIMVISLSKKQLYYVGEVIEKYNLDFDDAYQVTVAMILDLDIISEDSDLIRLRHINPPPVRVYTLGEMAIHLGIP